MDTTTALEKIQMIKNERQARIAANERAKVEAEAAARAKARTEAEELLRAATESLPEFLRPFVVCDIPDDWTPQYRALSVRIEIPEHSTIRANYSYTGGREPLWAFEIAPKHIVDPEIETALEWHVAYYVTQTNGEYDGNWYLGENLDIQERWERFYTISNALANAAENYNLRVTLEHDKQAAADGVAAKRTARAVMQTEERKDAVSYTETTEEKFLVVMRELIAENFPHDR